MATFGERMTRFRERLGMIFNQPLYHTAQSLVRPPSLRRFLASLEAKTRPARTRELATPQARALHRELITRGHTGDLRPLSSAQIQEMVDYLMASEMSDYSDPSLGTFTCRNVPKECHTAIYPLKTVVRIPHLFTVANNPHILSAIENLFGCKPQVGVIQAFWRFPTDAPPVKDEFWHRDFETLRFLKCFLYLTDVTPDSGPHQFVEASHRINKYWKMGVASDAEIEAAYGREFILSKLGPAGTCFLEETNGWHKGAKPTLKPRLAVQIVYSIRPCRFRDRPLISPQEIVDDGFTGFDAYIFQNHVLRMSENPASTGPLHQNPG